MIFWPPTWTLCLIQYSPKQKQTTEGLRDRFGLPVLDSSNSHLCICQQCLTVTPPSVTLCSDRQDSRCVLFLVSVVFVLWLQPEETGSVATTNPENGHSHWVLLPALELRHQDRYATTDYRHGVCSSQYNLLCLYYICCLVWAQTHATGGTVNSAGLSGLECSI